MRISSTTGEIAARTGSDRMALQMLKDAGFEACDFSMWNDSWHEGVWALDDAAFDAYYTDLRSEAARIGIAIGQAHAPFPITTKDEAEDAHRLWVTKRAIRAAGLLGAPYIVIHPALHLDMVNDPSYTDARAYNMALYAELLPAAREAGVSIALENMFSADKEHRIIPCYFSDPQDMLDVIAELGDENLCVCLDIGHALVTKQPMGPMIHKLAPHLKLLHVHDNDGLHDLHIPPYFGKIDWDEVIQALREVNYAGTLNLEADSLLPRMPKGLEADTLRLMAGIARSIADRI